MSKEKVRASLRKTTVESSHQLELILQERELKKQQNKSKKLATVTEKQLSSYGQEVLSSINLAENLETESSLVTDSSSTIETTVADPLGVLSPSGRARSISTELNRLECGNVSAVSPERAGLFENQDLNLNVNLSIIDEVFESNKMDENDYKAKLKQARLHKRQFNTLLSTFTAEDVTNIIHKNIYENKLNTIGGKFMEISNWFDSFIIDLEDNEETDRIVVVECIQNEIKAANRAHEKLILDKISDLVSCQSDSGRSSPSVAHHSDASAT